MDLHSPLRKKDADLSVKGVCVCVCVRERERESRSVASGSLQRHVL